LLYNFSTLLIFGKKIPNTEKSYEKKLSQGLGIVQTFGNWLT
jgi:hypothetical protein